MVLRFVSLITILLPLCAATSHIFGYSTQSHFLCNNRQSPICQQEHSKTLSQSQLPSIFRHLSTGDEVSSELPLSQVKSSDKPEIVLHIAAREMTTSPSSILRRIAVAVSSDELAYPTASSFQATTHVNDPASIVSNDISVKTIDSIAALQKLASEKSSIFSDDVTDYLSLNVHDEDEEGIVSAIHTISSSTSGKLAVVWTVHQDTADKDTTEKKDAESDKKDETTDAKTEESEKDKKDESTDAKAEEGQSYTAIGMNHPEINEAQLVGLLVTGVFLLIFIPGFMCLWNIQSPQTFEIFSSENLMKKMQ